MALQLTTSSSFPTTNQIAVPASASFIGSSEDALVLQSLVLNATTDRLREYLLRNLGAVTESISKIENLSATLRKLGKLIQSNWVSTTYSSLQTVDKTTASLRAVFAQDGPNLGDSLEKSRSVLAELISDGVMLDAPKKIPVMTEQFAAVSGKVDFSKPAPVASIDWRSDQEIATIDPGTSPGSFPGSVVKTIESRDSSGKLISVTRTTVFVDYANLRPRDADLDKEFTAYSEKIKLTLDDLGLRLADTLKDESSLNQRIKQESAQIRDDQRKFFEKEQENSANLAEIRRLFRVLYLEVNNLRLLFDKKIVSDTGVAESRKLSSSQIVPSTEDTKSVLFDAAGETRTPNPYKSSLIDEGNLLNFKGDISAIKNLLYALNKSVDRFSEPGSGST